MEEPEENEHKGGVTAVVATDSVMCPWPSVALCLRMLVTAD